MIGLWIMGFAFAGMYYFVFKAAFYAVPNALSEAAVIDGANNHQIFLLINFPLVKNNIPFCIYSCICRELE